MFWLKTPGSGTTDTAGRKPRCLINKSKDRLDQSSHLFWCFIDKYNFHFVKQGKKMLSFQRTDNNKQDPNLGFEKYLCRVLYNRTSVNI